MSFLLGSNGEWLIHNDGNFRVRNPEDSCPECCDEGCTLCADVDECPECSGCTPLYLHISNLVQPSWCSCVELPIEGNYITPISLTLNSNCIPYSWQGCCDWSLEIGTLTYDDYGPDSSCSTTPVRLTAPARWIVEKTGSGGGNRFKWSVEAAVGGDNVIIGEANDPRDTQDCLEPWSAISDALPCGTIDFPSPCTSIGGVYISSGGLEFDATPCHSSCT